MSTALSARAHGALGHHSQDRGRDFWELLCEAGGGLKNPCESLPAQDTLWFRDMAHPALYLLHQNPGGDLYTNSAQLIFTTHTSVVA